MITLIYISFTVSAAIVPILMIFGGKIMASVLDGPNNMIGFRTALSMRSEAAWKYANRECGRLWQRIGWIMLPVSVGGELAVSALLLHGRTLDEASPGLMWVLLLTTGAQIACMLISIHMVQKRLRSKFDDNGTLLEKTA